MHSPWQTTWRSTWIVGTTLLVFACLQLVGAIQGDLASPVIAVPIAVLAVGILTLVIAIAFRCGLHLSGLKMIPAPTAITTSAVYLSLLTLTAFVPIETHPVAIELPTTGHAGDALQSQHAMLMVPIGTLLFAFFVLPLLVAYGVARYMRARAKAS